MFDKKGKEEKKTNPIPEGNLRTRVSTRSHFAMTPKREVVLENEIIEETLDPILRKWIETDKKFTYTSLKEIGWKKTLKSLIVLKREIASLETFDGKQELYYKQKINYSVRPDYKFVYLKKENSKIYIRDFMTGITFEAPKNSNGYIIVRKDKAKRISEDEIRKLAQKGELTEIFGKVIEGRDGPTYGKQVFA